MSDRIMTPPPAPAAHTPLPWRATTTGKRALGVCISGPNGQVAYLPFVGKTAQRMLLVHSDADLIVRAVNNHAALLAALEAARDWIADSDEFVIGQEGATSLMDVIDTAIRAARGEG